jgi:hypothetical protein
MAHFLLLPDSVDKILDQTPETHRDPKKKKTGRYPMSQRESNRHSRHKAPKFKETREDDLCWEDRREHLDHRKQSDKKSNQKNKTRQKW